MFSSMTSQTKAKHSLKATATVNETIMSGPPSRQLD